jgi:glycosyltransferase involved in cell wall biosynthesis
MVSVIIPYFNRSNTLARALDSVRNQNYQDYEIILINDGSTDHSETWVNEYIDQYPNTRFKHISQKNSGPSTARNNGIMNSEGKYIAFLDSDDAWEPQKLSIQIEYMEENPDMALTGTNYYIVKELKRLRYKIIPSIIEARFYYMLFKVVFLTSTVIVCREIFFRDNIWFKAGKNQAEDLLLFLQIVRRYRAIRFSTPLADYFKSEYGDPDGLTSDLTKLFVNELDNLKILYSENKQFQDRRISSALYGALVIYTYLKHYRRTLKVKWSTIKS